MHVDDYAPNSDLSTLPPNWPVLLFDVDELYEEGMSAIVIASNKMHMGSLLLLFLGNHRNWQIAHDSEDNYDNIGQFTLPRIGFFCSNNSQ